MQVNVRVPQLHRRGNWVAWEAKIGAYLSLRTPPLDGYLYSPPEEDDEEQALADKQCRSTIILYIDDDLTKVIRGCTYAHEAFTSLKQVLLHELKVRGQICNQNITKLTQGSRSTDDYLSEAQSLMIEAQDINEITYMKNLCSRLIMGLNSRLLNLLGDNLMIMVETSLRLEV
jgi:hypothetical protein